MTAAEFGAAYGIDPETVARLEAYRTLLIAWQARMNLVAASTLPDFWQRHVADSAQLATLVVAERQTVWLDIGSGAGFPALVLALLAPGTFHLVEARAKKCEFLAAAAAVLGVAPRVVVHRDRIENLPSFPVDVVTARATASLTQLFDWGGRFASTARWLLPKGRTAMSEVATAQASFVFQHALIPSRTDPNGRIVVAHSVRRRRR